MAPLYVRRHSAIGRLRGIREVDPLTGAAHPDDVESSSASSYQILVPVVEKPCAVAVKLRQEASEEARIRLAQTKCARGDDGI
jgi:hypothetical protein